MKNFWLLLVLPFIVSATCQQPPKPIDKCAACELYTNIETKRLCKDNFCPKPVVTPTASPVAPTSTPVPTPNPTLGIVIPEPSGTPPWNTSCTLPTPRPVPENCTHTKPGQKGQFYNLAVKAQENVFAKYPTLFTYVGKVGCEWQVVDIKDQDKYYWNVALEVTSLDKRTCTQFDGENVGIKSSDTLSEQYHVLINDGCVNNRNGIFVWTCQPSTF